MRIGVWLIGARGNIATLLMVGAQAIANGLAESTGMVTAHEPVASLDLPAVEEFVFAGNDVRAQSIEQAAEAANEAGGVPDRETLDAVREDLRKIDDRVNIGTAINCGQIVAEFSNDRSIDELSVADIVARIRDDYATFVEANDLVRLVAYADEHGEGGLQPHLASFFKSPKGVDDHDLSRQFELLSNYAERHTNYD